MKIDSNPGITNLQQLSASEQIRSAQERASQTSPTGARRSDRASTQAGYLPSILNKINSFERASFQSRTIRDTLDAVQRSIQGAQRALTEKAVPDVSVRDAQTQINGILRSIDDLTQNASLVDIRDNRNGLTRTQGLVVTNQNAGVTGVQTKGELPPGVESVDVEIEITASAQNAGLFLSFGGTLFDTAGAAEVFLIEVEGELGNRSFSFASGTRLSDFRDAINTFTSQTGVSASISGTGLRLDSTQIGSDEFVSVKTVNDAGVGRPNTGIYQLVQDNAMAAYPPTRIAFNSVEAKFVGATDLGQDIEASFNGVPVESSGTRITLRADSFGALFDLSLSASQTLGSFFAFTLSNPAQPLESVNSYEELIAIAGKAENRLNEIDTRSINAPLQELIDELRLAQEENESTAFDPQSISERLRDALTSG